MAELKTYAGGCHCGKVAFEADAAIDSVVSCNCSICAKRGSLLSAVGADAFRLKQGEDELIEYRFNKHNVAHMFCKTCGILPFARGKSPKSGAEMVALNVRCLEGIDIETLTVIPFDGASL